MSMKIIPVHLPAKYLDGLDVLIEKDIYPNRSEAIRMAIRDMLKGETREFAKHLKSA
nr:ribbon-helix-helix domain-containing protein [Candidatus Sigynarchaeota archaeon]